MNSFQATGCITTPNVKTLLDTTRVQRTVGSMPLTSTMTTGTPLLLQYPPGLINASSGQTFVTIPASAVSVTQTVATLPVAQLQKPVTTAASPTASAAASASSATKLSPSAKIIDLTEDEDSSKLRAAAAAPRMPSPGKPLRPMLAPTGTQFVPPGTFQLVVATSGGLRQGLTSAPTMAMANGLVTLQPSPTVTPGTVLARAAATNQTVNNRTVQIGVGFHVFFMFLAKHKTCSLKHLPQFVFIYVQQ